MKKTEEKKSPEVEAAQHILNVACNSDFFTEWAERKNTGMTHKALRAAALDLLAEQFPNVDVKIVTYPTSEYVDLEAVEKRPEPAGSGTTGS